MLKKYQFFASLSGNAKKLRQFLVLLSVLLAAAYPVWGQKRNLTEADYRLWENTETDKLSPDGRWASYNVIYESGSDTLFVRSTSGTRTYALPSGWNSVFTKDGFYYCQSGSELWYINLGTGKQQSISGLEAYGYSKNHNLVIYLGSAGQNKALRIQTPAGKLLRAIGNAVAYSISPDGGHLLCSVLKEGKYALLLIDLGKIADDKWIGPANANQFARFAWSKNGRAAAFFSVAEKNSIRSLFLYRLDQGKLFEFDPTVQTGFPANTAIITSPPDKVLISDDLQRVFFHIRKNQQKPLPTPVPGPEIWNANDKLVYSLAVDKQIGPPRVMMWQPMTGKSSQLTSEALPKIMFSGDQQHALLSNPLDYEPQYDYEGPRDYYLLNLATMDKRKILNKASPSLVIPSPDGHYITYFKNNNWWTYNIQQDVHTNITGSKGTVFAGKVMAFVGSSAFGSPGWSADNKEILLYDQYDIWAIKPDGSASRRLTHGREQQITYRIGDNSGDYRLYFIYDGPSINSYDLDKQLILNAKGSDGKTGYFIWKNNRIEKTIAYEDSHVDQLHYTADNEKIIYRRQQFDLPPQLIFKDEKGKENIFLQSNPQHQNYRWGKSELVRFENSKHQKLKGVLYYPAAYDPQKKYPMIVSIYEVQSGNLHNYLTPSMYNGVGFNPAVLTSQGYFVFLPDIIHEDENIGPSSLDCVTAGVEKVIYMGSVDRGRIGLMGHSFGGYETAFIANHTKLFKTAIASGAITDLSSYFLSIGWGTGRPDMWRFHSEQWRMNEKTPFENPEDFNRNSPMASVTNLQIPLLLWSGKEDLQVDWHQSIEYYLAMRRLGKKGIMLLYPKEGHILANPANQEDVTRRVLQWFGHYLKDEKSADWIAEGTR